ncbi:hypothetical protein EGW35_05640 [Enterococcus durans]|uniref:YopX family protein n=1 Tax=Enterococcus durans TaxID=53345 RepID=UPI000F4F28CC|nr:YopX family protein [Enterococcus durans]ROX83694.1 hypothetical protein EGW35_05640 [Enterococcus durans]
MIPKFRAWDKECMEMANVTDISYKGNWVVDEPHIALDTRCDLLPFDDIELMQSTGLKDKNDVEIFEGDIVKTLGVDLEVTFSTIKFEEGAFCVDYKNLGVEFDFLYFVDSPLEVIGNIWENGELLEEPR